MLTICDAFKPEDRVEVKFSDFYQLMKQVFVSELLLNAVNCNVPHKYIREMATGIEEEENCFKKEEE